jgi:hypothetical protein
MKSHHFLTDYLCITFKNDSSLPLNKLGIWNCFRSREISSFDFVVQNIVLRVESTLQTQLSVFLEGEH